MSFWAGVVRAIHLFFVLVVVISPFYAEQLSLTTYVVLLPFVVLHWVSADNTCILTAMERKLRLNAGEECSSDDDLFIGSLISPVYDVHKHLPQLSDLIYIGTLLLWLFAAFRLRELYLTNGIGALLTPAMPH